MADPKVNTQAEKYIQCLIDNKIAPSKCATSMDKEVESIVTAFDTIPAKHSTYGLLAKRIIDLVIDNPQNATRFAATAKPLAKALRGNPLGNTLPRRKNLYNYGTALSLIGTDIALVGLILASRCERTTSTYQIERRNAAIEGLGKVNNWFARIVLRAVAKRDGCIKAKVLASEILAR